MNDDASINDGQAGSVHQYDSYLETDLTPGSYFIRVGRCCESELVNGTYELQVSLAPVPEPHNYALMLVLWRGFFERCACATIWPIHVSS